MAPSYCCVFGCFITTLTKPDYSFFRLPTDADRRAKWLRLISREELLDTGKQRYNVCEGHFNTEDILKRLHRNKLKRNALPALNLASVNCKIKNKTKGTQTEENCDDNNVDIETCNYFSTTIRRKRKFQSAPSECRKQFKSEDIANMSEKEQSDLPSLIEKCLMIEIMTHKNMETQTEENSKSYPDGKDQTKIINVETQTEKNMFLNLPTLDDMAEIKTMTSVETQTEENHDILIMSKSAIIRRNKKLKSNLLKSKKQFEKNQKDTLQKLCDKFLTKELAESVREQLK